MYVCKRTNDGEILCLGTTSIYVKKKQENAWEFEMWMREFLEVWNIKRLKTKTVKISDYAQS